MIAYIIPITTLLLTFMALLASLRFIFSRQGFYWVFPAIISLLQFFQNLKNLLMLGEMGISDFEYSFDNFYPFIMAFLWYMMVVVFHYALKKTVPENNFENEARKNKTEAEYIEKYERRKSTKARNKKKTQLNNKATVPNIPEYRTDED